MIVRQRPTRRNADLTPQRTARYPSSMNDPVDVELKFLARLHYALAILTAIGSLLALPFIWIGIPALRQPLETGDVAGILSFSGGVVWASLCVVHAGVLAYIGRLIRSCRRWWLVIIFSVLHIINVPLGTALSIYVFIVLRQESVKTRFGKARLAEDPMRDKR